MNPGRWKYPRVDRRQLLFHALVAAITGLAAVLRLAMVRSAQPYPTYVDEHFVLEASAHQIAHGTWDTGWSWYPSLLADLTTALAHVLSFLGAHGLLAGARATEASPYMDVVEPFTLVLAARLVVVACSAGIVWLVALLGARLAGRRVGVLAAVVAAALPAFVRRGSIVITDTPAAFFALAVLYGAVRVHEAERPRRWAIATGIAFGLAFTSKYTAVYAALSLVVVLALRRQLPVRERVLSGLAAFGSAAVTALAVMPRLALRTDEVLDAMRRAQRVYQRGSGTRSYLHDLRDSAEVGTVIVVLAVIGMVFLLRSERARDVTIGYVAFASASAASLFTSSLQPFRNLLPLLPFLCIATAAGVVGVVDVAIRRRDHLGIYLRGVGSAAAIAAVCLPLWTGQVRPLVAYARHRVDSRVEARRWLEAHVRPGDRVVVAEELAFLPSELERIDAHVEVRPQFGPLDAPDADFVVRGSLGERPYAWIFGHHLPEAASFGKILASCPRDWTTGGERPAGCPVGQVPGAWTENQVLIVIYGRAPT